jgi:hypothetical protein
MVGIIRVGMKVEVEELILGGRVGFWYSMF